LIGTTQAPFEENHVDIDPRILKNMVAGLVTMSSNKGRSFNLMKTTLFVVLFFVLCFVAVACVALDNKYPTNLELIGRAVRQAADSMKIAPPEGSSHLLEVQAGEGHEASWLLDSVLKERLLAVGWRIRADSGGGDTSVADSGYLLRLQVADLGLQFGRSWRRYVFGGKVVERVARVSLYYELIDLADDRIEASSNVGSEVVDVVPASMLPALSNSKYSFASPQLEKSQWDRYLEGGLVIAIIGVLVYLFYSNKTAS
jgi:hypothetical protein